MVCQNRLVPANLAQGIHSFVITDDNFARNQNWEAIFDRLIYLREVEKIDLKCSIQVDTGCHRIPNFIDKARRAGAKRVFIGLENINPANLKGARKNQNKITEYRQMLLDWKRTGAIIFLSEILVRNVVEADSMGVTLFEVLLDSAEGYVGAASF